MPGHKMNKSNGKKKKATSKKSKSKKPMKGYGY